MKWDHIHIYGRGENKMDTKDKVVIVTDLTCKGTEVYINGNQVGFIRNMDLSLSTENWVGDVKVSRGTTAMHDVVTTSDIKFLIKFLQEEVVGEQHIVDLKKLKE